MHYTDLCSVCELIDGGKKEEERDRDREKERVQEHKK